MGQRQTKNTDRRKLQLRKEMLRALDQRVISDLDLAQVAGGNRWPRKTCDC